MADSSPNAGATHRKDGGSIYAELPPHAYDPQTNPELFEGVLARRVVAFIVDLIIIVLPLVIAAIFIFFLGLITFGLGWALFWLLSPASIIWALFYCGMTLGSPASATIGMRTMDLELRTWYGAPCYFVLGAVHAVWSIGSASASCRRSFCWSVSSTRAGGCCTIYWSARS